MIEILGHIVSAAMLAVLLYWKWVDHVVSLTYPMHTTGEKNDLAEGDDGYYSATRGWIIVAVVVGLGILAWVLIHPLAPAVPFGILNIALLAHIPKNRKTMLRRQEEQFAILREIRRDPEGYTADLRLRQENKTGRMIFTVDPHFMDVREYVQGDPNDRDEIQRVKDLLTAKMRKLARMNERDWWDPDRAKNL